MCRKARLYLSHGNGRLFTPSGWQKAYVIGEGALVHELYKAGFTITDINPDFVIVGETRSYNWDMMHKAAYLLPMVHVYCH